MVNKLLNQLDTLCILDKLIRTQYSRVLMCYNFIRTSEREPFHDKN